MGRVPLETGQRCSHAAEVIRAGCQGFNKPPDLSLRLRESGLQLAERWGHIPFTGKPIREELPQPLPVEDLLQALFDARDHGRIQVGDGNPLVVTYAGTGRDVAAADVVRRDSATNLPMALKPLAAARAHDQAREQVGRVPGAPAAEDPPHVLRLGGAPELCRYDRRGPIINHDVLRLGAPYLAALSADLAVPALRVADHALIHAVSEDRPHRSFRPDRHAVAAKGGRGRDASLIEPVSDGGHAETAARRALVDERHYLRLTRIDHKHHGLAARLPAPLREQMQRAIGLLDRAPIAVGWATSGPVSALSMGPQAPLHDLAQLDAIVMRHGAPKALHELPSHTSLVGAGLVRVEHPDARPVERVLVPGRLIGLKSGEPGHVVAEHHVGRTATGIRTELQQSEEATAALGVKTGAIVGEFLDDSVVLRLGPRPDRLSLLVDRQVLMAP